MIEGIVVMGTMLVFLGTTMWAFRAYGGKIDQAASVRRDALYLAAHACEKPNGDDPDTYADPALKGANSTSRSSSGSSTSSSLADTAGTIRGKGGGFEIGSTARAEKGPTEIRGIAITWVGADCVDRGLLVARLRTASAVGCNEKRRGNGITALLRMGWSAIKSLVSG